MQQAFRINDWQVQPIQGTVTDPNGQATHLEPKVIDVLVCLAESANQVVPRGELVNRVWENHGGADELLTGAVSDLRRGLALDSECSWHIETVPKRGYRLVGNVSLRDDLTLPSVDTPSLRSRPAALVLAAATLLLVIGVFSGLLFDDTDPRLTKSVAVLPFFDRSESQDQGWFVDGLTEEILAALSRTSDIRVASRAASFAYRETGQDISTIARDLRVAHILEGSVLRDGDRLHVIVYLTRTSDGTKIWSDTFDDTFGSPIDIQERIAADVANSLKTAADPEALAAMVAAGTISVPAWEAFLQGNALFNSAGTSGVRSRFRTAWDAYRLAVELDPEFARGHLALSGMWLLQLWTTNINNIGVDESPAEMAAEFHRAIDAAIRFERDPVNVLSYRAQKAVVDLRFDEAVLLLDSFLERRPNSDGEHGMMMVALASLGRYQEGMDVFHRYYSRDIRNNILIDRGLQMMRDAGDLEALRTYARHAAEDYIGHIGVLYQVHRALLWAGEVDEAALLLIKLENSKLRGSSKYLAALRQACAEGRLDDARALYGRGIVDFSGRPSTVWISHLLVGADDAAESLLMQVYDPHDLRPISNYLRYGFFDPSPYPELVRLLKSQGADDRTVATIPYRCDT